MNFLRHIFCTIFLLVIVLIPRYLLADEPSQDASEILAVIPVKSGSVDKTVYHQFDRVVPQLKKMAKSRIIKLECRYSGRSERPLDVQKAYMLAANIVKYLREHHKLDLDLWVSIDISPESAKVAPVLTIAAFSEDIKNLDAVRINPQNIEQQ